MGMNKIDTTSNSIRPLNSTRPSTPTHRKKKFDFLRRRGDRHPLRKDDAVHVRTRVFQQSVTFVARMEYDSNGESEDLKPTSPATVETKEYWLDDWSHNNKPGQYYSPSSFDTAGSGVHHQQYQDYHNNNHNNHLLSASSASSASSAVAAGGGGILISTADSTGISNNLADRSNNNDTHHHLLGSPSPGQLFAVAAVSTACFFLFAGVMALIVWKCCRLKKGKAKQGGEKAGQGDKIFDGPTGGLGSDDPGEAPPSYFQKQGDSLVLVRSDSKGEGFQTTVCRAGAGVADEDDDHDHYYYYRPALPRSISAPLKDLQGLKISCPAGASGTTKPGPADERKLSSFLGPDGPPPPYSYERLMMSPSGPAIKSGWATTGPPGSRSGRHFQQQQCFHENQEWTQHPSLHRHPQQHQHQQRRGTYGGAEGGGDPSAGALDDNGTDKQILLTAEYAQQHGSPAQAHHYRHQQYQHAQQQHQQHQQRTGTHPTVESMSSSTSSPRTRQVSYPYHAQCSPSSSAAEAAAAHPSHHQLLYGSQQQQGSSAEMARSDVLRGDGASSGMGGYRQQPCHRQNERQQHFSPHHYCPGGLIVKAVPYGSSGVLTEADLEDIDDPYAGCDINPDLKSRSLPNRLKKKQPHILVPAMAMAGCPSGVVPSMPSFKFTRKLKNRMKNDTAALIALAKSTGDCCEVGKADGDTEQLIAVPPRAKVVYEERTCL